MHSGQVISMALLFLVLGLGVENPLGEATKRHFTVADDIGLAHFGDPYTAKARAVTFSPDGRYFVVDTERGLLEKNRSESTLWVYRTEDVHQSLLCPEMTGESSPLWVFSKSTNKDGPIIKHIRWLADSSGFGFLAETGPRSDELFLADLKSKSVHALTPNDQHVTAFDIHDRNHFVYSVESPIIRERAIRESHATSVVGTGRSLGSLMFPIDFSVVSQLYDLGELWAVVNGNRFRVDSKSSGRPISLHSDAQNILALSPDGRSVVTVLAVRIVPQAWETLYPPPSSSDPGRIRASRQDPEALDGNGYVSEYVVIELSTGKVKPLTNAPTGKSAGWWSFPGADWSPDGESVLLINTFLGSNAQNSEKLSVRPCVAVVDVVKNNVTCIEFLKGKAKTKTGFEDGTHIISSARFAQRSGRRVNIDYWEMDHPNLATSDWLKKSTSYMRSDDGLWTIAGTSNGWTAQEHAIELDVKESFTDPPVLVATDKTIKTSRVILDPNPQLKDVDLGEASVYKWKDKNGRDWAGGLYKPPDYMQRQRYPLVIQTHGFVESLFRPDGVFPTAFAARELAAAGILVLQVSDCPATGDPGESACNVAGYEAAIQQLVGEGLVDADRVGIIGFSRTCYYVLEALTTSSQNFKAASITDGVNFSYLEYLASVDLRGNGYRHEADQVMGASPFGEGLRQWFKQSPDFNLDKVKTPLQVVVNGRVGLVFMWEPYAVLRGLNKPVDLIVLRQGTHVLTNPAERIVSQGGTVDWFRFWLKDEEDPDAAKVEQYGRWRELRKLQEENQKALTQAVSP